MKTGYLFIIGYLFLVMGAFSDGQEKPLTHEQAIQTWQKLKTQYKHKYSQGRYQQGIVLAKKALEIARVYFGKRHPDTLESLNNLATLYQLQGEYGKALPLYKKALRLSQEVLGEKHPNTLNSLNNHAVGAGNGAVACAKRGQ